MNPETQPVFEHLAVQFNMKECIPDIVERPGATFMDLCNISGNINCKMNKAVVKKITEMLASGNLTATSKQFLPLLGMFSVMQGINMDLHFDSVEEMLDHPLYRSKKQKILDEVLLAPLSLLFVGMKSICKQCAFIDHIEPDVFEPFLNSVESLHALRFDTPTLTAGVRFLNLGIFKCAQKSNVLGDSLCAARTSRMWKAEKERSYGSYPDSLSCSGCGKESLNGAYELSSLAYYKRPSYFLSSSEGMATIRWSAGGTLDWETPGKKQWVLCFLDDKRKYLGVQAQYTGTDVGTDEVSAGAEMTKSVWSVQAFASKGLPVLA
jgi:hypothetical protein